MKKKPSRSDLSGAVLDADAPARVTYLFEDGHRRVVTLTVEEATELRERGTDRTTTISRIRHWFVGSALVKWVAAAIVGAIIAGYVSDMYADKQRELEIEGDLTTAISKGSIELFQEAQNASRATTETAQRALQAGAADATTEVGQQALRDRAADHWVLASGSITPVFAVYYSPDSKVVKNWNAYQSAMYQWVVLGCCTTDPGRPELVQEIRDYLNEYVGPAHTDPPIKDPWKALAAASAPDSELYQWVGLYLLRGRGKILADLRRASPNLD